MGAAVTIDIRGAEAIERQLAALERKFGNLEPLMEQIGMVAESGVMDHFEHEEGPDGKKWQQSIRARETGGKTLTDSARLKNSVSYRATSRSVAIGTNVKYAGAHQDGATITASSGGKLKFKLPGGLGFRTVDQVILPARPFLGWSRDIIEEIGHVVEEFARDAGGGLAGGRA